MRVLIGNDDGIDAPGLALLSAAASRLSSEVWIVAPSRKWTAASHQLSFDKNLALERRGGTAWACTGAPADCVVAAMTLLFTDGSGPDLVLSGVNDGLNVGEDALYSGTLAYAREACFWGVPAIALSAPKARPSGSADAGHVATLIDRLWQSRDRWTRGGSHLLSVNLPSQLPAPIAWASPGRDKIASAVVQLGNPTPASGEPEIRFRISRRRPETMAPGDQRSTVSAGHIAVTRFAALAADQPAELA